MLIKLHKLMHAKLTSIIWFVLTNLLGR